MVELELGCGVLQQVDHTRACQDEASLAGLGAFAECMWSKKHSIGLTFAGDRDGSAHVEVRHLQVRHGLLCDGQAFVSSHTVIQQQKACLAATTAAAQTGSRFSACIACSVPTRSLVIGPYIQPVIPSAQAPTVAIICYCCRCDIGSLMCHSSSYG